MSIKNKVNYKGIEGLEKIRELYINEGGQFEENNRINIIDYFMESIIKQFKSMQKEIDENWRKLQYYEDYIIQANKRVKKLEQENSYYPNEEEIKNIKVGGTD